MVLKEGQYGEWLKGVRGRASIKGDEMRLSFNYTGRPENIVQAERTRGESRG